MPTGDKDKYTDKQKRKAEHIEESYKERGVSEEEAEKRAWATVNAMHHGGEKPGGGGYGKPENKEPARKVAERVVAGKRANVINSATCQVRSRGAVLRIRATIFGAKNW